MNLPNLIEARKRSKDKVIKELYRQNINAKGMGVGKTYHVKTYGCQMNEHDSENIKALLEEVGFTEVSNYEDADLVLLNTCSIRENAHNKAFGMLGRLKHLKESKPDLVIGLCGCMAQEEGVVDEILKKYKYINFVFGTHNIDHLPTLLLENFNKGNQVIEVYSNEGNIVEDIPVNVKINLRHMLISFMVVINSVHIVLLHLLEENKEVDILRIFYVKYVD